MIKKITNLYIFSICINSTDAGFDHLRTLFSSAEII